MKEVTHASADLFGWGVRWVCPLYVVRRIYSLPLLDLIGKRPVRSVAAHSDLGTVRVMAQSEGREGERSVDMLRVVGPNNAGGGRERGARSWRHTRAIQPREEGNNVTQPPPPTSLPLGERDGREGLGRLGLEGEVRVERRP